MVVDDYLSICLFAVTTFDSLKDGLPRIAQPWLQRVKQSLCNIECDVSHAEVRTKISQKCTTISRAGTKVVSPNRTHLLANGVVQLPSTPKMLLY